MLSKRLIGSSVALVAVFLLLISSMSLAGASSENRSVASVPDGFDQYLVYLSEPSPGAFDPVSYEEFVEFQAEIWERDEDAIAAFRAEAIEFFDERFGVDFSDAEIDERTGVQEIDGATLSPSFVRPERNYQAHTVGGEWVPSEGWEVRDASFNVSFSQDTILHGEYGGDEGKVAPEGSIVVFGDYNINVERPGASAQAPGRGGDEIHIRFQSGSPISMDDDGVMSFVCDLIHLDDVDGEEGEWGTGQARGMVTPDGGIRNVLTFPASLDLGA